MRRYLFIILTLMLISSCIRDVSYEPEMVEDRVILNAQIRAEDTEHTVYAGVSKTNTVTSLHGAEIRCIVNGVLSAMASEDERGWSQMQTPYTFKADLKPGDKIRLELDSEYGSVWCETVVPESSGRIGNVEITDGKDDLNLSIQVEDTSPNRNYYMLRCVHRYKRDVTIFFSENDFEHRIKHFSERVSLEHSDDPILDGAYLGSDKEAYDILGTGVPNIYCIFSDRKFENAAAAVNVSISKKEAFSTALDYEVYLENDIVKTTHWLDVSLCSLTKEEYDYLSAISTLKVNDFDSSALMEDAAIPSNVNGGEGFVTVYVESLYEISMRDLEIFVKHNLGDGQLDQSLGRVCEKLIVDGQAPDILQPVERTLNSPSFWKHRELGRASVKPEHNLQCPSIFFGHPISKCSMISSNTPSNFHLRK